MRTQLITAAVWGGRRTLPQAALPLQASHMPTCLVWGWPGGWQGGVPASLRLALRGKEPAAQRQGPAGGLGSLASDRGHPKGSLCWNLQLPRAVVSRLGLAYGWLADCQDQLHTSGCILKGPQEAIVTCPESSRQGPKSELWPFLQNQCSSRTSPCLLESLEKEQTTATSQAIAQQMLLTRSCGLSSLLV